MDSQMSWEKRKLFGESETRILPLDKPQIEKPYRSGETKYWYLCFTSPSNLKFWEGEMWIGDRKLTPILLEGRLTNAWPMNARSFIANSLYEGLTGKDTYFDSNKEHFAMHERLSESGKALSFVEINGLEYPLTLGDITNNRQILYPAATTAIKRENQQIIGIEATQEEWASFQSRQMTDPKIEVLL